MKGKGFVKDAYNKVKDWFLPSDFSSNFKKVFDRFKDFTITRVVVGREPVNSMIQKFVNLISLGKFEQAKKDLNYDDVFHLYALLTLSRGGQNVTLRIEKNEVIKLRPYSGNAEESMTARPSRPITLQQFIRNGINAFGSVKEFVRYDAVSNNCQRFISTLLRASGMLTPELSRFITQDAEKLLESKFARKVGKTITDVTAGVSQMMGGKKKMVKRKLMKLKRDIQELATKEPTADLSRKMANKKKQFKKVYVLYKNL